MHVRHVLEYSGDIFLSFVDANTGAWILILLYCQWIKTFWDKKGEWCRSEGRNFRILGAQKPYFGRGAPVRARWTGGPARAWQDVWVVSVFLLVKDEGRVMLDMWPKRVMRRTELRAVLPPEASRTKGTFLLLLPGLQIQTILVSKKRRKIDILSSSLGPCTCTLHILRVF